MPFQTSTMASGAADAACQAGPRPPWGTSRSGRPVGRPVAVSSRPAGGPGARDDGEFDVDAGRGPALGDAGGVNL